MEPSITAYICLNLTALYYTDSERRKVAANVRDIVASGMTPSRIGKAQKFSKEWKPKRER